MAEINKKMHVKRKPLKNFDTSGKLGNGIRKVSACAVTQEVLITRTGCVIIKTMSGERSRRGSALLNELSRAEAKIGTLEEFIREREKQFHVAVSRLHGGGGGHAERRRSRFAHRRRRAGITQDALLRMRTMSQDSMEHIELDCGR